MVNRPLGNTYVCPQLLCIRDAHFNECVKGFYAVVLYTTQMFYFFDARQMFVPYQVLEQLEIHNSAVAHSVEDVLKLGMITDKQFL